MSEPFRICQGPPRSSAAALLEAQGLPTADLTEEHFQHFFFMGNESAPEALVGLEIYGQDALLRSLVVSPGGRTRGLGSALVLHAEGYAAAHDVRTLYLLTTTAESYFEHRGYRRVDRADTPPSIRSTRQFAGLCPASSAFMIKRL